MGLFSKIGKKDSSKYGSFSATVDTVESRSRNEIVVFSTINTGRVALGETITYKPCFGRETPVKVERIEAMMMDLEFAMEGSAARFTLSGDFSMLNASANDSMVRE